MSSSGSGRKFAYKQRWSAAAFLPEKTAALSLFAGDEKSSAATATKKVAALVAPLMNSAAVPITDSSTNYLTTI